MYKRQILKKMIKMKAVILKTVVMKSMKKILRLKMMKHTHSGNVATQKLKLNSQSLGHHVRLRDNPYSVMVKALMNNVD